MATEEYRETPRDFEEINEELKEEERQKRAALKAKVKHLGVNNQQIFAAMNNLIYLGDKSSANLPLLDKVADFADGLSQSECKEMKAKLNPVLNAMGLVGKDAYGLSQFNAEMKEPGTQNEVSSAGTSKSEFRRESLGKNYTYAPSESQLSQMDVTAEQLYNDGVSIKRMRFTPDQLLDMPVQTLQSVYAHGYVPPTDMTSAARVYGVNTFLPYRPKRMTALEHQVVSDEKGFFKMSDIHNVEPNLDVARETLESSKLSDLISRQADKTFEPGKTNMFKSIAASLEHAAGKSEPIRVLTDPVHTAKSLVNVAFANANQSVREKQHENRVAASVQLKNSVVRDTPAQEFEDDGPRISYL